VADQPPESGFRHDVFLRAMTAVNDVFEHFSEYAGAGPAHEQALRFVLRMLVRVMPEIGLGFS
jgi:hypothetical protein